jgi:prepilin-type N-terminal cleavage/methylation domain-containing protein
MKRTGGFSLLEVIIALLIFSASLLSYTQLLILTFRSTQHSYLQSVAELDAKKNVEEHFQKDALPIFTLIPPK